MEVDSPRVTQTEKAAESVKKKKISSRYYFAKKMSKLQKKAFPRERIIADFQKYTKGVPNKASRKLIYLLFHRIFDDMINQMGGLRLLKSENITKIPKTIEDRYTFFAWQAVKRKLGVK